MGAGFMVSIAEILKGSHTGKAVQLRGWIYRTRTVGGKAFVVVRDATGIVQVAISRDAVSAEAFAAAVKALIESAVIDESFHGGSECLRGKDRKSTRLNSSHVRISYAVFCLTKKTDDDLDA